jgi:flagellar basal body P-ring protein FlgI
MGHTGKYTSLRIHGLTNAESMSYGDLVTARISHKTYALCCGNVITNTEAHTCSQCSHALKWVTESMLTAQSKIEKYINKCINRTSMQIDYKQRHAARVAAARREKKKIEALKAGINAEKSA